jgi:hypothetical protein
VVSIITSTAGETTQAQAPSEPADPRRSGGMEKLDHPKPRLVAEPKQSAVQILGTGSRPGIAAPLP